MNYNSGTNCRVLQKSEEVTTLQGQINDLTAAASAIQENGQKQIEGLGTRIQMLESELARQTEEKEGANALLNEVGIEC